MLIWYTYIITKFAFYEGQLKETNVLCTRTAVKELASAHLSWSETLKATKNQLEEYSEDMHC